MEPHWQHEDEASIGDRVVLVLILIALIVEITGLYRGWFV
jgi:hypothetical protein